MRYKYLILLLGLVMVLVIGTSAYMLSGRNQANQNNSMQGNVRSNRKDDVNQMNRDSKVGIIYFSATGTTKTVAEYIQEETNGSLIEIVPREKYTNRDLSYGNDDARANEEQNDDKARPAISNQIDVSRYDTLYFGFPIWWGDVPKIILTFLDTYDLRGKTVIPFCTSSSTGISTSMRTLKSYQGDTNWIDGKCFTTVSKSEIHNWIEDIKEGR